jgi:type II secretory pathway component PulF
MSDRILKKPFRLVFPIKEQILFTKRLSLLIRSGVPISKALTILYKQTSSKGSQYILSRLITDIEHGKLLSAGLQHFKHVFSEFAINSIRVGETSGSLHENLDYLSEELRKKLELKRKITSAFVYPVFIVIATLGITIFLTGYIFPKIIPVFSSFRVKLPWATRVLMAISYFVAHDWVYMILSIIVGIVGFILMLRMPRVRFWFDTIILKLPLIGTLFKNYYLANSCRAFSVLLTADVKIVEACTIVSSITENRVYKKQFLALSQQILKGETMSNFIVAHPTLFPSIMAQMLIVGEEAGSLSGSLQYLARMYEDELNDLSKNLTTVIEPVLMIAMGLIVGFVALAMITPIYTITQSLHA